MVKIILFVPPVVEDNLDVEARELGWLDNDRSNHLPRRRLCEAGDPLRRGKVPNVPFSWPVNAAGTNRRSMEFPMREMASY